MQKKEARSGAREYKDSKPHCGSITVSTKPLRAAHPTASGTRPRLLRSPSIAATPCKKCQRPVCVMAVDNGDARNGQSARPPGAMTLTAPLPETG